MSIYIDIYNISSRKTHMPTYNIINKCYCLLISGRLHYKQVLLSPYFR